MLRLLLLCDVYNHRMNARWVSMTTVHWYKATSETFNTPQSLLDEDPIRLEMDNLAQLVKVSNK
jgi:hypothetical protein